MLVPRFLGLDFREESRLLFDFLGAELLSMSDAHGDLVDHGGIPGLFAGRFLRCLTFCAECFSFYFVRSTDSLLLGLHFSFAFHFEFFLSEVSRGEFT